MTYITKDSGERARFDSGMQRDTEAGKPRFDLTIPKDVPFEQQFLTRVAALMGRGAEKYEDRNWEQANSEAELERMKSSAFRHFMQWFTGETDEDHAAATVFNLLAYETTQYKLQQQPTPVEVPEPVRFCVSRDRLNYDNLTRWDHVHTIEDGLETCVKNRYATDPFECAMSGSYCDDTYCCTGGSPLPVR